MPEFLKNLAFLLDDNFLFLHLSTCILVLIFFLIFFKRKLDIRILKRKNRELIEKIEWIKKNQLRNFKLIERDLPIPIWVRDKNSKIIYCNDAYINIAEDSESHILQQNIELSNKSQWLADLARNKNEATSLKTHIVYNEDRVYHELNEIPVVEKNKKISLGYAINLNSFENLENKVKYHISLQKDLLESSATAIAIYNSKQDLEFFNNSFIKLWKFEENFLEKKPDYGQILEDLRARDKLPEQKDFRGFKKECLNMFTNLLNKHEELYYLPDGRIIRVVIIPLTNGGLLFSYDDQTDRITLERSYNTLISVKKSTIDNLKEAVCVFGEDGILKLSNPSYLQMWGLEEMISSDEKNIHFNEIAEKTKYTFVKEGKNFAKEWGDFQNTLIYALNSHKPVETVINTTDNRTIKWSTTPLPDGAKLMTYVDITDSVMLEKSLVAEKKALEQAHRMKVNFLNNISYELKSPLTSIKGFTELLLSLYGKNMEDKEREYIEDIKESGLQLSHMIDNVLDVTSIDAGELVMNLNQFNLSKSFSRMVVKINKELEEKDIKVSFSAEDNILINGDERRLKQAFKTFIENAINVINPKGSIDISVNKKKSNYVVCLNVKTARLAKQNKQNISLIEMYQDHNVTGNEMGTLVAENIIALHKGKISVKDTNKKQIIIKCKINSL